MPDKHPPDRRGGPAKRRRQRAWPPHGYEGSADVVKRRLRELRSPAEGAAQWTGDSPGQMLQVDLAEMPTRPRVMGRKRRVYALDHPDQRIQHRGPPIQPHPPCDLPLRHPICTTHACTLRPIHRAAHIPPPRSRSTTATRACPPNRASPTKRGAPFNNRCRRSIQRRSVIHVVTSPLS